MSGQKNENIKVHCGNFFPKGKRAFKSRKNNVPGIIKILQDNFDVISLSENEISSNLDGIYKIATSKKTPFILKGLSYCKNNACHIFTGQEIEIKTGARPFTFTSVSRYRPDSDKFKIGEISLKELLRNMSGKNINFVLITGPEEEAPMNAEDIWNQKNRFVVFSAAWAGQAKKNNSDNIIYLNREEYIGGCLTVRYDAGSVKEIIKKDIEQK